MENYEIKDGEYKFYITGVFREDKNGYVLKTSKGNIYYLLKVIVLDNGKSYSISHAIYGTDNIKSIVYAINNPTLTFVFESKQSKNEKFDPEVLIGESGSLLLGHREYQGKNYPKIECFLKTKTQFNIDKLQPDTPAIIQPLISYNISDNQETDNDVPF